MHRIAISLIYFCVHKFVLFQSISRYSYSVCSLIFTIKLNITTPASLSVQDIAESHVVYFHCLSLLNINLSI